MSSPTSSPRTLTYSELDALPVGAAVRCTTERGMRVVLALKVGVPQGSGGHIWRTTEYSTVPGSFAIAHADAVLLEPVEPGHRAPDVQVDGDNPALAATTVQDDALTGAGQGVDVGNARHEPVVGQSRHDAPRDIPSSAGGPATTPALARATEAVSAPIPNINRLSHAEIRQWLARAAVSAALTNDADPPDDLIARTLLEHRWDDGGYDGMGFLCICGHVTGPGEDGETSWAFSVHIADAVRAAILGARGNELDGGQA